MSIKSPMIRLAPVNFEDLPNHPSFGSNNPNNRPDLLRFALTVLDQGRSLVEPTNFNLTFKSHSWKPSPPSNNEVEILSTTVPATDLEKLPWSTTDAIPRPKPPKIEDEHWYARRSYHHNHPSKSNAPGTASFEEFVYGLRDHHSRHEYDFTPTIYDARLICEWNEELAQQLSESNSRYTHTTMSIYEMCHKLPTPLNPRCFPVLVATASVSPDEFIAVTVPVDITRCPSAFYSTGRNRSEGLDAQMRKPVTVGSYCAVERVVKYTKSTTHTDKEGRVHSHEEGGGGGGEEIEWIMATASHAGGNVPVALQRMGIPGGIAKDVGLFLKWIHGVSDEEVRGQGVGCSTARP
ncbi:hypothetical protein OHC33_006345 [Knufia fluminis]|uniref:DUF3074 domain-containing protein n=1 Tax=Knufia fluminis TaxID=191047 RepID=A0AAN8EKB6_9EURO|nr:hypothetical protein OHC33_006345 [Knufia fluminis]